MSQPTVTKQAQNNLANWMKKSWPIAIASLAIATLTVTSLTACSTVFKPESDAEELVAAIDNTVTKISATGVIATGTYHRNQSFTEVFDPNAAGAHYVNDSVLLGPNLEFRQISRQSQGDLKAFKAAIGFAKAKVKAQVEYASSVFNVLASSVVSNEDEFLQTLKLQDVYGNLGKFNATITYHIENALVTGVSFDQAMFDQENPEEVCIYSPTNCIIQEQFDFDSEAVPKLMLLAFNKYEVSQNLASGNNKEFFETIMRNMDKTVGQYKSWTTVNTDGSTGSVFDAATGKGVSFNPYDETTEISAKDAYTGRFGADSGYVSSLFFDTTDGGSTYFYGPISYSVETNTFTIKDSQDTTVAKLHFEKGILVDFLSNTIGLNEKFTISEAVDQKLLESKRAKVSKP
ncbi:MAG: hypothetical protein EBT86_06075 [Actinobacteria bacterium]|nr:hypothetical protein [Actinomycetota bacterium]NBS61328.1 hypothetical protein [Microbacteriaceae bacterium]NDE88464.1 hypothetical protein [Micrococcales bacterium]